VQKASLFGSRLGTAWNGCHKPESLLDEFGPVEFGGLATDAIGGLRYKISTISLDSAITDTVDSHVCSAYLLECSSLGLWDLSGR
jgi:hypothetical protein